MRYIGISLTGLLLGAGAYGLFLVPAGAQTLTPEQRAKLQAEYDQLQAEIAQWQKVLDETRAKKNTIQGDVTALDAQIKKAQAEIRQRNGTISTLAGEINERTEKLTVLEQRLQAGRDSLAKLLREKYRIEETPLSMILLASGDLSEFFSTSDSIDFINENLQTHFAELRGVRQLTEQEKQELASRQSAELDARYEVQVKQEQIQEDQDEKKQLLNATASEEKGYQQILAERQQRAQEIRTALFELRDAQGIPFSDALAYASAAEKATGVRAAFILGILRQESNLGQNVGQCLLVDPATGMGKGKNTGRAFPNTMNATRDVPPFLDLLKRLGRDPYATPVSCPQSVGYGGAMGPSQFIASTWKGYEGKLASALGVSVADPWVPKHAIMATALFLRDLGAGNGGYSAEQEAAGRYYAGGNWRAYGLGYASSVLSFAEKYQNDINFLNEL